MKNVVIIEGVRPSLMPNGPDVEQGVLGKNTKIHWHAIVRPQDYKNVLEKADAVITRPGTPFSKDMVKHLKNACVIVSLGVGYDHISINTARQKHIPVCNVPDYGTDEVADSTVAMILAHQRKLNCFNYSRSADDLHWDWRINTPIKRTNVCQVGIIGLGRIGTAVAIRLKAFGYKILFYDPYICRGIEKSLALERVYNMDELLKKSDIVTVHVPLNKETAGMINRRFLTLLKPQAILVNTARGGLFKDSDLLFQLLKKQKNIRIASDVWADEPPKGHALIKAWKERQPLLADRLILTCHSAFYSQQSIIEMRRKAAEIVKAVFEGKKPYNVVN